MFPSKARPTSFKFAIAGGHTTGRHAVRRRGLIGFLGWSGVARIELDLPLFPFLYLQSRSRLEALSAVFYYAGATWSVIPGAACSSATMRASLLPIASLPRLHRARQSSVDPLYHRRFIEVSAIAALVVLALPPLSLVTVAHPLISRWPVVSRRPGGLESSCYRYCDSSLPLVRAAVHRGCPARVVCRHACQVDSANRRSLTSQQSTPTSGDPPLYPAPHWCSTSRSA